MTALPSVGYQFDRWSGDIDADLADNLSVSVVMDRARTVTADFIALGGLYTITVNASLSFGGSATIETPFESFTTSANQTSVSVQCVSGTTVNISAVAAEGYRFDGWRGGITGSQGNMSFIVNSSETITARFSMPLSFPWIWISIVIVASLLTLILLAWLIFGMVKRPKDIQPEPHVGQRIVAEREEKKAGK